MNKIFLIFFVPSHIFMSRIIANIIMQIINTIALAAVAAAHTHDHHGHDHAQYKPTGVYWGINVHEVRADKVWTLAEVELNFKSDSVVDLKWFYGVKPNHFVNVPKQTFACTDITYTFDEAKLQLSVDPTANACLKEVNDKFPKAIQLPNPFVLPINETNHGDIVFAVARNMIKADLYPIDGPLAKFPSGSDDGLAPAKSAYPARRGAATTSAAPSEAPVNNAAGGASVAPKAGDSTNSTTTTTSGKNAVASQLSSIFVSIGAVVIAGLFL